MLQICRTCGSETYRLRTTFEVGGKPLPEPKDECPNCCSSMAAGQRLDDQRLWLMQDVNPNEYEVVGGVKQMKDWAQAEVESRLGRRDADEMTAEEKAYAAKRRMARELRGKRLTPDQIASLDQKLREQRAREAALDAGLALPT